MKKLAIVTGGSGSIGQAICRELRKKGYLIVASDVRHPDAGEYDTFIECDVTRPDDVEMLFRKAEKLGNISCVVIAHGVLLGTTPGHTDADAIDRVIAINLKGVALVSEFAVRYISDGGAILLMSSSTAFLGRVANAYVYQATKGAVESLTRTLAIASASRCIRVNCIAPGHVSVAMQGTAHLRDGLGGEEKMRQGVPLGRFITPEEIAKGAAFLCSDDASSITGVVLPIDGGQTAY